MSLFAFITRPARRSPPVPAVIYATMWAKLELQGVQWAGCAQCGSCALWMCQVLLLGLTGREWERLHVASDARTTEVLMQLRVCFLLSFARLPPSLSLSLSILLLGCATFNKCTKRMTTSASGAGPAVTAKNYMPCAKVLPLHYSNIKSSRSGKSTRVAVCNFSLAASSACYFSPAHSLNSLQSVKRGWQKTSWVAHAASRSLPRRAKKLYAAF